LQKVVQHSPIYKNQLRKRELKLQYKITHFCGCPWEVAFLASFCPTAPLILTLPYIDTDTSANQ